MDKLDIALQVDMNHKMEVTIINPFRSPLPAPIEVKSSKEIIVKKKTTKG